jgi:hypothetical protein
MFGKKNRQIISRIIIIILILAMIVPFAVSIIPV